MKLLSILLTFLIIGCSAHVAGGPGGQTTNGIVMAAYDIDGTPAANASVSVRRTNFLYGDPLVKDSFGGVDAASGTTNSDGVFEFHNVIPGSYLIEISEGDSFAVVDTFTIGDELIDKGDLTLNKTGVISGTVSADYLNLFDSVSIAIRGTDKFSLVNPDGEFKFAGLAPWTYTIAVQGFNSDTVAVEEDKEVIIIGDDTVDVIAGEILDIAQYTIVRSFMDSCGLESTAVSDVVGLSWGKITTLSLQNMGVKAIPSKVNELTFLDQLMLDSNSISIIPDEIGALNTLLSLSLSSNSIDSVPLAVSSCISLTSLNLSNNRLSDVDNLLSSLNKLKVIDISNNEITNLPSSITSMAMLSKINVQNNLLSSLPEDMMTSYVMLLILDLNDNRIVTKNLSQEYTDWLSGLHENRDGWLSTQTK